VKGFVKLSSRGENAAYLMKVLKSYNEGIWVGEEEGRKENQKSPQG